MTRRWLLLKLLEDAGDRGITTNEILKAGVGSRYGARLMELREAGHVVEAVRLRDGCWRYTLVWSPEDVEGDSGGVIPPEPAPAVSLSGPRLFEVGPSQSSHYDDAA